MGDVNTRSPRRGVWGGALTPPFTRFLAESILSDALAIIVSDSAPAESGVEGLGLTHWSPGVGPPMPTGPTETREDITG